MKTGLLIFWSFLIALTWTTASFANTAPSDSALDHVAQRNVHARVQAPLVAPPKTDAFDAHVQGADQANHSCLYVAELPLNITGSHFYFRDPDYDRLRARTLAQEFLIPPRF